MAIDTSDYGNLVISRLLEVSLGRPWAECKDDEAQFV